MLNDIAEDTGRVWVPSEIHQGKQMTWVEEYRTEGARVVLDDGAWFLCTDGDLSPVRDALGEREDRPMLYEASDQLAELQQLREQQLTQRGMER